MTKKKITWLSFYYSSFIKRGWRWIFNNIPRFTWLYVRRGTIEEMIENGKDAVSC